MFTKYKPLNVTYGIGKPYHDEECRVITLEYETFILISVYAPNSGEVLCFIKNIELITVKLSDNGVGFRL